MLTRDSYLLWVGLVAAIVTYLISAEKPPTQWSYMQWLQAASFTLAWIVGKLGSSVLAASTTSAKDSRLALGGLVKITEKD